MYICISAKIPPCPHYCTRLSWVAHTDGDNRACATVIPTKEVQGKLWLWPDASPDGVKASETVLPVIVPEFDCEDFGGNWYARDLNYGFDTLIENLSGEDYRATAAVTGCDSRSVMPRGYGRT